ncbi:uncharacterized protein LOC115633335 [Scaptodrosophila lebanonensis]|uniref:Uncharacterized protein LOC115633335 n=1 Tax=Drosophila lebanonensis TaxID=7225 RepID=A0A6J2UGS9_DROLE|nr:uncharacterized protein LOC115633335 [Scaptodrosophila lebanonensis]
MDSTPMTFTSLALLLLLLIMCVMFACHCLGPRAASWMRIRSNKEEKIGLSKHKLFHANGYMASIQSGSEFLLSTSGSFKRFDTIDREDHNRAQAAQQTLTEAPQQTTTPLWNLPQADVNIPPQPLRPAPAPNSAGPSSKTVTFSFSQINELGSPTTATIASESVERTERRSCLRSPLKSGVVPQPLEAPPPPRLTTSASVTLSSTAIPRPIAKRQSLQQGINRSSELVLTENEAQVVATTTTTTSNSERRAPVLTRRNSSTNPFLCESTESLQSQSQPQLQPKAQPQSQSQAQHNGNPFVEPPTPATTATDLSSRLLKLQGTTNPFTGLSQRVKGPHMLQKTISEDFLFRKLGVNGHMNGFLNGTTNGNTNGNSTWCFGRSLLRQDSTNSLGLGRRNSSQLSLDSTASGLGSMESINRAISCESVNSDSSVFQCELDQPYTQITGYLCIGLQYDKNSITNEGMELTVSVLEAKGLICPFSVESLDTFVRIYLVPDHAGAMQTKVVKCSLTPSYNENFNFWLKKQQGRHSLWFHLYHNGPAHTLIGEAEMEIGEMPRPITTWIPLTDSRKCNARWGELMFSLSYLPTAERLTIVVVKARNLKLDVEQTPVQHVFVKVYLMNNEKKVLKKRTSLKRKDRCPIFNESMIFSIPPHSLTTVQLRLTIFGVMDSNLIVPLGHVIAGSCAVGKGLRHWHQMLSSLRKPVAMWHVLRRAVNQPIFTGGAEAVVAAMQSTLQRAGAKRNSIV